MPSDQTVLCTVLDRLVLDINECSRQLLYGTTALDLGQNALSTIAPGATVTAIVGTGITIEPIPMTELMSHRDQLRAFTLQVIHEHMVQVWQSCLDDIFAWLLSMHFSGNRRFKELKTQTVKIDFQRPELDELSSFVQDRLKEDFGFFRYSDRVKVINDALSNSSDNQADLQVLAKHVEVRNVFQHHRGCVTAAALSGIGREAIELPDQYGKVSRYAMGDRVQLFYLAIDEFRRTVLMVAQTWRDFDG